MTTIQKWGNSLAVRLPKKATYGLTAGTRVRVERVGGDVIIVPQKQEVPSLKELLRSFPANHREREVDWGEDRGAERVWEK